jgi:spoIIIJ-associated protein
MDTLIVEGKSIEEALSIGLEKLSLTKDEIDYKILENKNVVKLKIYKRSEVERLIKEAVKDFVEKLIEKADIVIISKGNGTYVVNVISKEDAVLIGKKGKTLEAIQHIVSRIIHKYDKDIEVNVDVSGYREKKEHLLRQKAIAFAEEVKRSGNPVIFEEMPAYLRRIIHITLKNDKAVRTYTIGEGELKKVVIAPTSKK